ncbi:AAWKG family protein [Streptomyces sp. I4(2020)]|uniref:AAWKG family protein n=1 Tax=Streptomyces sp. I4(2020) TaxID=2760981 RepID=UPI0018EE5C6E|nr:AAWKG family protein [Streptomyces sp. I4(2020)]MBJ6612853.1 AAWKG family protein [Streptomyces sp. I3(2020)]MBJ6629086.1 AAWKG family protein [Streptomyces sp. I4(2020)]
MVDRYDANSEENVNRYEDVTDASSDVWASLVTHITGYPVPDRSTIFDTLRSDHGGKLFRMDIRDRGLGAFVQDASGFLRNTGEDYDIWFFDSGKRTQIKQARIVFEGRVRAGDEVIWADPGTDDVANASVREGNEFKDYNKDEMSTVALARYMNGPRTALLELRGGSTGNARFSNLGVAEDAAVDLKSFDTTGQSFDFAAQFFRDQGPKIKEWEDALGREDATWKGEAAEVFRSLLTKIRENYDAYIETFDETPSTGEGDGTGKTVYSRALSQARQALENAADKLLDAWITWANSDYYDPHRVLRYVLDDLALWVDAHNVANTDIKTTYSAYSSSTYHDPKEGFSQNHPEYGDLTDIANWAKVGDKAVQIWSRGVDEYLVKPARSVQSTLNNTFLDLSGDFTENVPKPKSTSTASQEYEERKAEEAQDEINRQNEENKRYQDELREEQNRQREEDRRYQDELREEQNRQREEDKRAQDELREEQNRQREEDKRYQDELREEQNRQREEDRRYQDELRAEQEKQADEAQEQLRTFNDRTTTDLDGLDDVLNRNVPVTESLGDVGGINGGGGGGDGSLTQNLGALGDANNAVNESLAGLGDTGGTGGGDQRTAVPPTANLGSLGGLNPGGGTRTPSDRTTGLVGGDPVARFPDGSSTRFDPDTGLLTTTGPDGTTTTTDLGNGLQVTNPDGSVTSLTDDGKLTTTFPDGRTETIDPSTGQAVTTNPDGTTTTTDLGSLGGLNSGAGGGVLDTPTGGTTQLTGGELTSRFPDGSSTSFDPDTGTLTTTGPDGSVTTTDLGNGLQVTNPDGSVTSLGDDGNLTTTFPDGTTQSIDPSTGQAVTTDPDGTTTTTDLGSLGGLNSGAGGGVLDTPTGGTTQLTGGELTSRFPDGSSTSFDPDTGTLTTTGPDGSVTTTDLGNGLQVTNPDGSVTSLGDDGNLTTTFPDGTTQSIDPSTGQAVTTDPDGTTTTTDLGSLDGLNGRSDLSSLGDLPTQSNGDLSGLGDLDLGSLDGLNSDSGSGLRTPTGGETSLAGDDLLTRFPDGTRATFDTQTGMLTATHPDGSVTTTDLTHGVQVNNPDGSVTSLDNGMLTTEFPDGSTQVVDPETGIATVTDAQGNTETVNLHDLNTGDTRTSSVGGGILDELDALDTLGGGGGVGGGTSTETLSPSDLNLSNGGSLGPASGAGITAGASVGTDGLVTGAAAPLSDGATATGGPLGPVAASGTAGAPGMPGTPGMPMGGMGGAGGGGDKGNGERVRAVLVDAAEESERRNRRRRSPWNRQEDSDTFLSPASRVATTGGDSPEEEATDQGRRATTSADYLEEDADVWGTEDGGTPAVIGR